MTARRNGHFKSFRAVVIPWVFMLSPYCFARRQSFILGSVPDPGLSAISDFIGPISRTAGYIFGFDFASAFPAENERKVAHFKA